MLRGIDTGIGKGRPPVPDGISDGPMVFKGTSRGGCESGGRPEPGILTFGGGDDTAGILLGITNARSGDDCAGNDCVEFDAV